MRKQTAPSAQERASHARARLPRSGVPQKKGPRQRAFFLSSSRHRRHPSRRRRSTRRRGRSRRRSLRELPRERASASGSSRCALVPGMCSCPGPHQVAAESNFAYGGSTLVDDAARAQQPARDLSLSLLWRPAARDERAHGDRSGRRRRTASARPHALRRSRASRRPPGHPRRVAQDAAAQELVPPPREGSLSQIRRGRARRSTSPRTWWPIQLTAQTTTTVPTYAQKPSMEKFGAIHSARATIAMLITR